MAEKKLTGKEKVGGDEEGRTSSDLAHDYGWNVALMNSDPDLRKLFGKAVTGGWEASKFVAELRDTTWFKTHGEAYRTNFVKKSVDPTQWKTDLKDRSSTISDLSRNMGSLLTGPQLAKIAEQSLMLGWSDAQIKDALGKYVQVKQSGTGKGQYLGDAGKNYTALTRLAKANGYAIPKGKTEGWLKEIAMGNADVDFYADHIRRQAAKAYPAYSDELLAGSDLEDLVSPYREAQANLLEVPPDTIGFDDKLMKKALSYRDAKGNPGVMPLYDYEDQIRKDTRWRYTDNAHKEVLGAGQDVLELMGFRK